MPRRRAPLSVNAAKVKTMESALVARQKLSGILGLSFGGDRDLYTALGYYLELTWKQYYGRYERQDIARRIVNAYPDATWRGKPAVYTQDGPENDPFATAWDALVREFRVYEYLNRVDRVAGIGEYAVLLLGVNDGRPMDQPAQSASKLLYLSVYSQENAPVYAVETDPMNPRYGLPTMYRIRLQSGGSNRATGTTQTMNVHWTRVLHVAEDLLEDEIYGTPRLRPVFNRLEDLARIVGGSAEMFWKGAFPGMAFNAGDGASWDEQSISDFTAELEEYFHSLKRYLRLSNVDVNQFQMQVADPEKHVDVQLKLISGATGIPVRILTGSERGELSSAQDENNWNARVEERRGDFAEPHLLRALIDRLGLLGILQIPEEGYVVDWPDLLALPDKDRADIGLTRAKILAEYVRAGGDAVMAPEDFLVLILGVREHEVRGILDRAAQIVVEEEAETPEEEGF